MNPVTNYYSEGTEKERVGSAFDPDSPFTFHARLGPLRIAQQASP